MIMSFLNKIKKTLWGDLKAEELKQFGMLGLILMFILGSYWLMRPLKDGIFLKMVGKQYLAWAKMTSVFIIVPLALIYAKLVDMVEKQKLFYVICTAYMSFFLIASLMLRHPTIGLANTVPSPDRILGWFVYLSIESFGTLVIALFWSFVASNTKTTSAKKGYGLIIFCAQVGTILGPLMATQAISWGIPLLALITAIGIFLVPVLIKVFITVYPSTGEKKVAKKQKRSGPIEGLKLLLTKPYLMGVLCVATIYEIPGTIIDFNMKFAANAVYATSEEVTRFLGFFGVTINTITLIVSLLGTSLLIRKLGISVCLIAFPTLAAIALFNTWMFPVLWVFFGAMVALRVTTYAVNNPCKEILYIPTSKDVKFKSKSWIDMFGARSAKFSGAGITKLLPKVGNQLMLALGIVALWMFAAIYTGKENKKLVDSGKTLK